MDDEWRARRSLNFGFLLAMSPNIAGAGADAERTIYIAPHLSLTSARTFCDLITSEMVRHFGIQDHQNLSVKIRNLEQSGWVPQLITNGLKRVRTEGNESVHKRAGLVSEARDRVEICFHIGDWFMREVAGTGSLRMFAAPSEAFCEEWHRELAARGPAKDACEISGWLVVDGASWSLGRRHVVWDAQLHDGNLVHALLIDGLVVGALTLDGGFDPGRAELRFADPALSSRPGTVPAPYRFRWMRNSIELTDLMEEHGRPHCIAHMVGPEELNRRLHEAANHRVRPTLSSRIARVEIDGAFAHLAQYEEDILAEVAKELGEGNDRVLVQTTSSLSARALLTALVDTLLREAHAFRVLIVTENGRAYSEIAAQVRMSVFRSEPVLSQYFVVQELFPDGLREESDVVVATADRLSKVLGAKIAGSTHLGFRAALPADAFSVVVIDDGEGDWFAKMRPMLQYFSGPVVGFTSAAVVPAGAEEFFGTKPVAVFTHLDAVVADTQLDFDLHRIRTESSDEVKELRKRLMSDIFPYHPHEPKTLIFARSPRHAEEVFQAICAAYADKHDGFAVKLALGDPQGVTDFRTGSTARIAVVEVKAAKALDIPVTECLVFLHHVNDPWTLGKLLGIGAAPVGVTDLRRVTDTAAKTHFVVVDATPTDMINNPVIQAMRIPRDERLDFTALLVGMDWMRPSAFDLGGLASGLSRMGHRLSHSQRVRLEEATGMPLKEVLDLLITAARRAGRGTHQERDRQVRVVQKLGQNREWLIKLVEDPDAPGPTV
ncbi:DUF4145 domain-containing protein [Herbidospora sp. RD11066]